MKRSTQIANDIYEKYGALVSVTTLAKYLGVSQKKARDIVKDLTEIGHNTGKRYFYEDVAEALVRQC